MALARLCAPAFLKPNSPIETTINSALRLVFACHAALTTNENKQMGELLFLAAMAGEGVVRDSPEESASVLGAELFDGRVAEEEAERISRLQRSPRFKAQVKNGKVRVNSVPEIIVPKLSKDKRAQLWRGFRESGRYRRPESEQICSAESAAHMAHAFKKYTSTARKENARKNRQAGAKKARAKKG